MTAVKINSGNNLIIKDEIQNMIDKASKVTGYEIYESVIELRGKNSKITVRIDSANPVTIDDCEIFSRAINELLESSEDIIPFYMLEVSSPGLNRKLRNLNDFKRFIGSPVKVVGAVNSTVDGFSGKLIYADDSLIRIEIKNKIVEMTYDKIVRANLDY